MSILLPCIRVAVFDTTSVLTGLRLNLTIREDSVRLDPQKCTWTVDNSEIACSCKDKQCPEKSKGTGYFIGEVMQALAQRQPYSVLESPMDDIACLCDDDHCAGKCPDRLVDTVMEVYSQQSARFVFEHLHDFGDHNQILLRLANDFLQNDHPGVCDSFPYLRTKGTNCSSHDLFPQRGNISAT